MTSITPPTTSICHNSIGRAFPTLVVSLTSPSGLRLDQTMPDQTPIHRRPARHRLNSLSFQFGPSDDKGSARLNCITHLLSQIPYDDVMPDQVKIPDRDDMPYVRPPISEQTFVPRVW